ncbi:MAG: ankyrin repeat domain-containing protein, partial [Bacteroidia bacterium]|nr:ankyrin repeat domain-containing protein [Bacteroidia bacterium]
MTNVHYLLTCLQYDPVYFEQMNLPGASFDDGGACLLTTSLGRAYSGQQIIYGVVLLLLVLLIKNKLARRSFLVATPLVFIAAFSFSFRPLLDLSMHPEKLSVIKPESLVSLFDAVATGNHDLLEKRLKAGANPNDRKEWRNRSVSPLDEAWRNCDYKSFVLLHQHGALLSIMYLHPSKDIRFMKYALENGVDPNKFNPMNSSDLPLYAYCNEYGGKKTFECIELLIRHGADVNLIPFGILQSHNI